MITRLLYKRIPRYHDKRKGSNGGRDISWKCDKIARWRSRGRIRYTNGTDSESGESTVSGTVVRNLKQCIKHH